MRELYIVTQALIESSKLVPSHTLEHYNDDRLDYNEDKMKMVAEMEIKLNGHQYEYKYE